VTVTIVNGQILANLVILSRAPEKDKSALLTEGDKDGRIYRKVVDPQHCRIFAAGNREIAIDALHALKKVGQKGVLTIVDADTDHLTKTKSTDPDLLLTHTRDAEGLLFQSTALKNVLIEFDLDEEFGSAPERAVLEAVVPLALVKFIAQTKKWTVKISQLDFGQFVDPKSLSCDTTSLCKHIASLTLTAGVRAVDYEEELKKLIAVGHEPAKVARGHDATSLLAWAIPIVGGRRKKDGALIRSYSVESYLRAAYSAEAFGKCELSEQMEKWEKKNVPYKILRR
jgi:hypothetical protein